MTVITHAGDRRGFTACGDTTSGRHQVNVDRHPEQKTQVTCTGCQVKLADGWTMDASTARLVARKG